MLRKLVFACAMLAFALLPVIPVANSVAGTPSRLGVTAPVSPVVPGVVYIKLKVGSAAIEKIAGKGGQIQSINGSRFSRLLTLLQASEIAPFDATAPADEITRSIGIDRMFVVYFANTSIDPHDAVQRMLATGEVESASARYAFPLTKTTNDPRLSEQYALTAMHVYAAWDKLVGDTNIVIADVDCATNIDHEDLVGSLKINWGETGVDAQGKDKRTNGKDDDGNGVIDDWGGVDVVGSANRGGSAFKKDGDPRPDSSSMAHGTETAGCIAATGNNGIGIAGVAYGCRLLPIKASDNAANIAGGYEGIHEAAIRGARIINCSWGGVVSGSELSFATDFLREATARNAVVVAAAGNFGLNNDQVLSYPADGPGVISVGSTNSQDQASGFSHFGHSVSVWAPGEAVLTLAYPGNSGYTAVDGTSFSSPLTAGVLGLIMSQHPTWPIRFATRQLIETCDNVVNPSNRYNYWGRVNASAAVAAPVGPGLATTSYSINGVQGDTLREIGTQCILSVHLKNFAGDGSNMKASLLSLPGYSVEGSATQLGDVPSNSTAIADFKIRRTAGISEGSILVGVQYSDVNGYTDVDTFRVPVRAIPGFVTDVSTSRGTGIKRVDNEHAWAAMGYEDGVSPVVSKFDYQDGAWEDPIDLNMAAPYCVDAYDPLTVWMGTGPSSGAATVIRTDNGGSSWSSTSVSTITGFVNYVHFFDAKNGIILGDPKGTRWGIGTSTDGGITWKALSKNVLVSTTKEQGWNNAACFVGTSGWFGSNNKRIWKSVDRGVTWTGVVTPYENCLAIGFDDDGLHGFACFRPVSTALDTSSAVNANGVLASSDGGSSWNKITLPVGNLSPGDVKFIPGSHIALLTSNYGVFKTTDFGATWSMIGVPSDLSMSESSLSISREPTRWVASIITGTSIISFSDTISDATKGVNQSPESQQEAQLLPCSPNPVQGSATISFAVPAGVTATVGLFDAVGRLVRSLYDGVGRDGLESVTADVRGLAAGVYYYSLTTSTGVHLTRSMTVLR